MVLKLDSVSPTYLQAPGRYLVSIVPPLQPQVLPSSVVLVSKVLPDIFLFNPEVFIVARTVIPLVVTFASVTDKTYFPVNVSDIEPAAIGQLPLFEYHSANGLLKADVRDRASET